MSGLVAVTPSEVEVLQSRMREIQLAASRYYAATGHFGSQEKMGVEVQNFLGHAQRLNDLLTNKLADRATYAALFGSATPHSQRDLLLGMKYARNVVEHVMYIFTPAEPNAMFGSSDLGLRVVAEWDEVPAAVHAELQPSTQKLKPHYEAHFQGREVLTVMFEVLRFFAEVAPTAVHRDSRGEWTGFPLQAQPAVSAPLHPEEPGEVAEARTWLDSRVPNGDLRVVGGQVTAEGTQYIVGFTFVGDLTFGHFVETPEQVSADIAAGATYVKWEGTPSVEDVSAHFPQYRSGKVHRFSTDLAEWTVPFDATAHPEDWFVGHRLDDWSQMIRAEFSPHLPDYVSLLTRKMRRLNAFHPLHP